MKLPLKRAWRDPDTGDRLGPGEHLSSVGTALVRRWPAVLFHLPLSYVWLTHPAWFGDDEVHTRWIVFYSLWAVIQEGIVGISNNSQAKRDARVMREDLRETRHLRKDLHQLRKDLGLDERDP